MRIGSLSGLLVVLVSLGIIIGVREFLYPAVGALGFGVPLIVTSTETGSLLQSFAVDLAGCSAGDIAVPMRIAGNWSCNYH